MGRYLAARIAAILGTLLIVSLFVFVVMHAIPGGPFDEDKMPLPAESKANILRSYGLDRPLWEQYIYYLWNIAHLDFGVSYQRPGESVIHLLARVWPVTMHLGGMALLIALPGGTSSACSPGSGRTPRSTISARAWRSSVSSFRTSSWPAF